MDQQQIDTITAQIADEETAHAVFHALMARFGWVGTVFTPLDVRSLVAQDRDAEDEDGYAPADDPKVLAVLNSYSYLKLADRLAERGNEVLSDALTTTD